MTNADLVTSDCDIGQLLEHTDLRTLSSEHRYRVLTTEVNPDSSSYPRTRPYGSGSFRQFQPAWKKQYTWLHYSRHLDGVFCHACAFFAPEKVGGQPLGQFVTKPFKTWVNKSQKMDAHAKVEYHITAMAKMKEFLARHQNPSQRIDAVLDKEAQKQMEDNQTVVKSLLKVVMLCGKQGLAFRGHRDDKIDWLSLHDDLHQNEGNFIELVRFRAETDEALRRHLELAPRNARYTSKTIQNELIDTVSKAIRTEILNEVKAAKFYSVIADEVTDIGNKEQLSISLRYVFEGLVHEIFIDFIEVERITGTALATAILQNLEEWGLSPLDMRGQCYDGAASMSGARSGCRAIVQQSAPKAIYIHCAAHQLNLAIVSACKIQAFRNTESCIGEIARFFHYSAKRQCLLDKAICQVATQAKAKKLKDACRTRWMQHIDSYVVFLELLPAVHMALNAIAYPNSFQCLGTDWNWDGETLTKANGFVYQLESSTFLLSFQILLGVLSWCRSLTLKLQMKSIDVMYAYSQVQSVVSTLKKMREESKKEFNRIFTETSKLGRDLHGQEFVLSQPRVNRRQMHRSNVTAQTTEEYYRITLYNEFLSHVVAELQDRFLDISFHGIGLLHLSPSKCCSSDAEVQVPAVLSQAVDFYASDLPHAVMFPVEYSMWVRKWQQCDPSKIPKKLTDALQACDDTLFPNLIVLLRLALTIPVTSCECERSFSQLKLIKTSRRSTTTSDRLSGLAMMKINRGRCDKLLQSQRAMNDLVRKFHQQHPRRMKLPFILSD